MCIYICIYKNMYYIIYYKSWSTSDQKFFLVNYLIISRTIALTPKLLTKSSTAWARGFTKCSNCWRSWSIFKVHPDDWNIKAKIQVKCGDPWPSNQAHCRIEQRGNMLQVNFFTETKNFTISRFLQSVANLLTNGVVKPLHHNTKNLEDRVSQSLVFANAGIFKQLVTHIGYDTETKSAHQQPSH